MVLKGLKKSLENDIPLPVQSTYYVLHIKENLEKSFRFSFGMQPLLMHGQYSIKYCGKLSVLQCVGQTCITVSKSVCVGQTCITVSKSVCVGQTCITVSKSVETSVSKHIPYTFTTFSHLQE